MTPIWVTLITGFLGSGKTTLLNALLGRAELAGAMVIVNEFGEIGVDSDLMAGSSENVVQLANGCLCCSVKSDLIDTFRDLVIQRRAGTLPPFERVIIETTGIADPVPVLEIILTNPMVRNAFALDGVITVLDAVNGAETLASFPESVKQVAIADRIILTKSDLNQDTDGLIAEVRRLNASAPVLQAQTDTLEMDTLFGTGLWNAESKSPDVARWLAAAPVSTAPAAMDDDRIAAVYRAQGHAGHAHDHTHGADIRSFCLVRDEPVSMHALELFLDAIARQAGPRLLRVKGLVHVAGEPWPAVIQGAQRIFHSLDWLSAWPSDDRRTRIVFITKGLEQDEVEDAFALIERVARRTQAARMAVP